jgi:hypothetical protein
MKSVIQQRNESRRIVEEWHGEVVEGEVVGEVSDNKAIVEYTSQRNVLDEYARKRQADELAEKIEQAKFIKEEILPWLSGREVYMSNKQLQDLVDPEAPKEMNWARHNFVTYSAVAFALVVALLVTSLLLRMP